MRFGIRSTVALGLAMLLLAVGATEASAVKLKLKRGGVVHGNVPDGTAVNATLAGVAKMTDGAGASFVTCAGGSLGGVTILDGDMINVTSLTFSGCTGSGSLVANASAGTPWSFYFSAVSTPSSPFAAYPSNWGTPRLRVSTGGITSCVVYKLTAPPSGFVWDNTNGGALIATDAGQFEYTGLPYLPLCGSVYAKLTARFNFLPLPDGSTLWVA